MRDPHVKPFRHSASWLTRVHFPSILPILWHHSRERIALRLTVSEPPSTICSRVGTRFHYRKPCEQSTQIAEGDATSIPCKGVFRPGLDLVFLLSECSGAT